MSTKPSRQQRNAAKSHRSDAAFWKSHSEKHSGQNKAFFRQAAANHLKAARNIERGK